MIDRYIQQHGKRLYGLCVTLCANVFDADDLYQETWLRVVSKFYQYDEAQAFEAWLTQICVNIYRNMLRRKKLSPIFDVFASSDEKDAVLDSVPAAAASDYSQLHAAIDKLPDKLRTTIVLYYFRDLDVSQTAVILKIPPGTVKSRLHKAKKLLKEEMPNGPDL